MQGLRGVLRQDLGGEEEEPETRSEDSDRVEGRPLPHPVLEGARGHPCGRGSHQQCVRRYVVCIIFSFLIFLNCY